ncbi:MAG TPA: DUF1080 domain-containing protein [Verrucomicrobiae bacterium]|nr:DUF1080 domain-containing protein [Verrucomicrobiae bacterium]
MNTLALRVGFFRLLIAGLTGGVGCLGPSAELLGAPAAAPATAPTWVQLFNGKDLTGWDTWLGPRSGGYHDRATSKEPALGLNVDPLNVFTVSRVDGAPAIHVSGQVFGAITSKEELGNCRIRVEYKWGEKKWPPRDQPKHYRDSGILYWCMGEHGAGSYAWMRSVECNIMEKGVGQWWSVDGTYVDIEGRRVTLENDPRVPYRGEGPGEKCFIWEPGTPRVTTGEGITSLLDPEKAGAWNVCEVVAWGNVGLHLLNGQVVLALTNPRYKEKDGRERRLTNGKIQLQSEGAEVFYRKVEVQRIAEIPADLLPHVPAEPADDTGFVRLFGSSVSDGWAQCGPGQFVLEQGVATGQGGMGLWWYTNQLFTNFVLRGEWLQEGPDSDSGVFVRFPNPGQDPWVAVRHGHEFEIGESAPKQAKDGTGSFYPFHGPVAAPVKPWGQWNSYELICIGPNYSLRINGQLVNTWTDNQDRPEAGYVGLQNYPYRQSVRHRNFRIKALL